MGIDKMPYALKTLIVSLALGLVIGISAIGLGLLLGVLSG